MKSQESVASVHRIVLSLSLDFNVIPPPSIDASLPSDPLGECANSIFLSSTVRVVELTVVVVPFTVRLPPIVVLPVTPRVPPIVVAPVTPRVPAIVVLPLPSATVNLSVSIVNPPFKAVAPVMVVAPVTSRVPPIVLLPVALNVPVTSNAQAGVA